MLISNLSIVILKFRDLIPDFGHFGPKSINLLILTKFCMYPNSKVLISNLVLVLEKFEAKCPNQGIFGQKVSTMYLNEILRISYVEGADIKSDFRFRTFCRL